MNGSRKFHRRDKTTVAASVAVVFWLLVWQLASWLYNSPILLPGPLEVVAALVAAASEPRFWLAVARSSFQIALGIVLAYALALPLAAVSSRCETVRQFIQVPLHAVKAAPIVCIIVLLLLWFGASWVGFAAVVLMALPGLYFPVLTGFDHMDQGMRELFDVHRVAGARRMLAFSWQQVCPFVRAASAGVVGMSWKAGVAAELIGSPAGSMGERIFQAKLLLETADVFAWTVAVVCLAVLFERLVLALLDGSIAVSIGLALRSKGPGARTDRRTCGSLPVVAIDNALTPYGGVSPISLSLDPGARVCLMAPSGAGKTTCLRMAAGLIEPSSGSVGVHGRLSVQFQDARLIESATSVENVLLFAADRYDADGVSSLLLHLVPDIDLDAPVNKLSGGQRRRVELLRAMVAPGDAILLDEPFAGLDEATHHLVAAWVKESAGDRALIVATHDCADVELLDAKVYRLGKPA
ncbi:ATP-binding cassette domain-containing protein [Collinsella sp. UBA1693]|uniref:ATP-binding cassette domain-containing protein n=1 Tax=Collinsella sp. UBA1693 TaxID=1946385 RepID=UPI00258100D9|nr:ATP-binding cassette domain-containing protein [Collinsella sp. UBA1693]